MKYAVLTMFKVVIYAGMLVIGIAGAVLGLFLWAAFGRPWRCRC